MLDAAENQTFVNISLQAKPVPKARLRKRHLGLIFSFVLCVMAPVAVSGWYLYERAADQYASRVGFSVRKQEVDSPVDLLGGLGALSGSTTLDTDILYEFIQSQDMVELIDAKLNLRAVYSKPDNDPIFSFEPNAPIEELVAYWRDMVAVYYDSGTGLIDLRVRAFETEDAVQIAEETLKQASLMINRLSAVAREDSTRYARTELDQAVIRLKIARQKLTQFRVQENIVDPEADVQVQMSLLGSMQQQLAESLIELDLLLENTREGDTRVSNLRRRVDIIQQRIESERQKFGIGGDGNQAFSTLIAEFEALSVDLEFAQTSYLSALTGYNTAIRQAQQQSRYLATYLKPTRPQSAEFPQRLILLGMISLFAFLIWSLLTLVYYSVKDRT
ncbi:MAG: sugar transporter [Aliishimia sp.]